MHTPMDRSNRNPFQLVRSKRRIYYWNTQLSWELKKI